MSGITGGLAQLDVLTKRIRKIASGGGGGLLHDLAQAGADEALTQVHLGFRKSVDPFGNPWAPLKYRDGQPLRHTGVMEGGFEKIVEAAKFFIRNRVFYSVFHQKGARGRVNKKTGQRGGGIPARKMIPDGSDLGTWKNDIRDAINARLERFLRGG